VRTPLDDLIEELTPRAQVTAAWLGWAIACVLAIAVVVALSSIARAQGQPRVAVDCADFSLQMRLAVWARDMKADENLVAIYHRTVNRHLGFNLSRAIEREVRRAWQEKLPADKAVETAHRRCLERLGELGAEG